MDFLKKYCFFPLLLIIYSCDSTVDASDKLKERAQGDWTWLQSSGGWVNYTPETLGDYYLMSIRDNDIRWYRNDTLQFSGTCTFEHKPITSSGISYDIISLYPNRDSVLNEVFPLSDFLVYVAEIRGDSLLLNPDCNGVKDGTCYGSVLRH